MYIYEVFKSFKESVVVVVLLQHFDDVIMGEMASQITSLTIVYSTVYSGADQRKHQSSASLAFVQGIHREPVNSPHKWPVTRKMFPFDDVIMNKEVRVLDGPRFESSSNCVKDAVSIVVIVLHVEGKGCHLSHWLKPWQNDCHVQTTFWNALKKIIFDSNFIRICSQITNWYKVIISSDKWLSADKASSEPTVT